MTSRFAYASALALAMTIACGSASSPAPTPQLEIVTPSGAPLSAVAGDALTLTVVERMPDGTTQALPSGATVAWSAPETIATLPPGSGAASPVPAFAAQPTVAWISNPYRPDRGADLANVLFVLDAGTVQNATVQVSASVTGVSIGDSVTAEVAIDPTPAGDWTRGGPTYAAACADCHGATGGGSSGAPEATSYSIAGASYDFPAPGINAAPGNTAGDPAWNAALFAVAARADMGNGGITLRYPMPDWLAAPNPSTGQPLSTQDLADIYAFLKTQTH